MRADIRPPPVAAAKASYGRIAWKAPGVVWAMDSAYYEDRHWGMDKFYAAASRGGCLWRLLTWLQVSNRLLAMNRKASGTRLPSTERRATTVQAVLALAATENPADITTSAIAQRMHITQGALFRHFATKEAIWQAVIEWVTQRMLARVEEAARTAESSLEALETVFMAHIESHVRHAGVPRIIFGELQRAEDTLAKRMVRKFMGQYVEKLQGFIEQGKDAGEIDREVDAKAAATLFVGMIQGLVVQSLVSGNIAITRKKAREIFALYLRAVGRAP